VVDSIPTRLVRLQLGQFPDPTDIDIEEAVYLVLEQILGRSRTMFRLTERLARDLRIDSDDLSFDFTWVLERSLDVKVPVGEWAECFNGEDAIRILKRNILKQRDTGGHVLPG